MTRTTTAGCVALAAVLLLAVASLAHDPSPPPPSSPPPQPKLHVYLLIGQSNMAGRGAMTADDRRPVARVVMMNKADAWTPAHHPIHFDKPIAGVGLGLDFARAMLAGHADDGVVIALVPCAVGGTPLSRWQKGGDLYANAVRRAKIALKDGELRGVLWHQGESDSENERLASTYAGRLDAMIGDLRRDLDAPEVPFVAGGLNEAFVAKSKFGPTVVAALRGLGDRVLNSGFASAADLQHKGDATHFDADALRAFGRRYAAVMLAMQGAAPPEPPSAGPVVVRLDEANWDRYAPAGKEVDAIYGDFVLANDQVRAVIAAPVFGRDANMMVRDVGGCLIDLTRTDGSANDQLHVLYPANHHLTKRGWRYFMTSAKVESAGGQGKEAALVCEARTDDEAIGLRVRYSLADGQTDIRIATTWTNRGDKPLTIRPSEEIHGSGFEPRGGGVPGVAVFENPWWSYGIAIVPEDESRQIAVAADNRRFWLRYRPLNNPDKDDDAGPLTIAPGGEVTLTRFVIPQRDGVEAQRSANAMRNVPMREVRIAAEHDDGIPASVRITLRRGESIYGTAMNQPGGSLLVLPEGEFNVELSGVGYEPNRLSIPAAGGKRITLAMPAPGRVQATITDAAGGPIPCKVQFIGVDGAKSPDWFPHTGERFVRNCAHTPDGSFTAALNPGKYRVIISRGPEYDAVFTELTVERGKTARLAAKLTRTVDTAGWVSADFHSHSSPSGDNDASQFGRVLTHLVEHIEYAPCTEHNRIDTYAPHLRALSAEHLLATSTGIELTTSPGGFNHQNAFPLKHKPRTQDGGGPSSKGDDPVDKISRLALWDDAAEKLVQQNHPNIPQIADDEARRKMLPYMDVIEVHPPGDILKPLAIDATGKDSGANRIASWITLLNRGIKLPGVVNTDAHYNFHGVGWLRNYIKSPTDDPAKIDTLDIVCQTEKGHVVMTTGPFMTVQLTTDPRNAQDSAAALPGDTVVAANGKGVLHVKVQCPNWLDIDRVFVLVNGKPDASLNFTRAKHAAMFADGVVKFDQRIPVTVKSHAHLIVVAVGEKHRLGEVMGPDFGRLLPVAVANPIYLDADGDGWTAPSPLP